ncbi:hypothetical protein KTE28_14270 [Burkholderia multivorans]|uniref:hypothetical protein n=1 Tax=Burkholderia multivorans TaxID=87883 RepID=UPI001C25E886|nr:hypothetical protein [Burkholderia multivorans]MBU9375486.1 hypothetical protein [Burkholderia multivorans]
MRAVNRRRSPARTDDGACSPVRRFDNLRNDRSVGVHVEQVDLATEHREARRIARVVAGFDRSIAHRIGADEALVFHSDLVQMQRQPLYFVPRDGFIRAHHFYRS